MLLGLHKNLSFNSGKVYPYATGGDYVYLYEDPTTGKTYRVHEFLSTGTSTLEVEVGGQMEVLIVAGGGAGGQNSTNTWGRPGGGGAGGVLEVEEILSVGSVTIEVGNGGAGVSSESRGNDGGNSSFGANTASGGGGGSCASSRTGRNGGSGGGGMDHATAPGNGGTGVSGQGNRGGNGRVVGGASPYGGGGGGAGAAGGDPPTGVGGNGIKWLNGKFYGGGGGAAASGAGSFAGGSGGGGTGRNSNGSSGTPGTGGGGGGSVTGTSGSGGSGIVIVRYVISEKKLWTPSELTTLAAWYDASEISGLNNNDSITTWIDKSGNSRNVSNTNTNRPTYKTNVLNGNSVLEFDGSDDYLKIDSSFLVNLGESTIAWIARGFDVPALPRVLIGESSSTSNTPVLQAVRLYGATYEWTFRTDANVIYNYDTASASLNTWAINLQEDTLSALNYAKNGLSYTQAGTYTRTTTTVNRFSIGCDLRSNGLGNPGAFFYGQVGEIIIIDGNLSLQEKQKLEGYLAHKWGLTNNLPSGHPYKYEPPYKVEPEEIVTDGLVLNLDAGDYASYPRSGTTWYDISGNGLTGALTNGPTYDSANKGSIVFDGSDDYVLVGNDSSNQITTSLTLEAWVYPTQFSHTNIKEVIAKWDNRQYKLAIAGTVLGVPYGYFYIDVSDTGSNDIYRLSSSTLTLNSWNHIVGVYTSGASPSLNVYLNGTLNNGNLVGSVPSSIYNGTSPVYIGSHEGRDFKGNIATARIYNRALSSTEISQNFNALRGRYGV